MPQVLLYSLGVVSHVNAVVLKGLKMSAKNPTDWNNCTENIAENIMGYGLFSSEHGFCARKIDKYERICC